MPLDVAIAAEGPDTEIYRQLLSQTLNVSVNAWTGPYAFTGCKSVAILAPQFLQDANNAGIKHALLAIDNDGGSQMRQQHHPACVPAPFNKDDDDSCRECWLEQAIPPTWSAGGNKHCVAVPVQTIETWLLTIRGTTLNAPTPEQYYHRPSLKKAFYGKALSIAARLHLALAELAKPNALTLLAQRPSFVRFTDRLATWP